MPLEKADQTKTKRFTDGAAWLVLRTQVNKGESDTINDLNSRTRITGMAAAMAGDVDAAGVEQIPNSREVNRTLFDILAVEWSLGEAKPTARDYDELTQAAAEWVDECISDAIREGRTGGAAEGNSSRSSSNGGRRKSSARKPAASRTTSPAAAG